MNLKDIDGLENAFWKRVEKGEGDDACWEWTLNTGPSGYGSFSFHAKVRGSAHRISYELEHGTIPRGMFICHRCDNRKCVRPSHLFAGTHEQNAADMVAKARYSRGRERIYAPAPEGYRPLTGEELYALRLGLASEEHAA